MFYFFFNGSVTARPYIGKISRLNHLRQHGTNAAKHERSMCVCCAGMVGYFGFVDMVLDMDGDCPFQFC